MLFCYEYVCVHRCVLSRCLPSPLLVLFLWYKEMHISAMLTRSGLVMVSSTCHLGGCFRKRLIFKVASLVVQVVKNPPVMQETRVRSLHWEDSLGKWQPTTVFLPGESHRLKSLVGYSPWGVTKSRTRLSN